jgi:hypothetical protein
MAENEIYIEPEIHCLTFSDYGQPAVTRFLSSQKRLADIDLSFLKYVMKRWKKRNRRLRQEDEHNPRGTKLIFPLEIDRLYDGEITLCRIDGEGKLSPIDKWLIKQAFIFRAPANGDDRDAQNIESSIRILNETVIKAIRALSKDQFDAAYREYKNFHLLLLELGEAKSNGENINYGIIEGSWFGGSLYKDWAHSYRNIFDESVAVLPQQDDFFRTCSYTAYYLIDSIFFMPSMTGLNSVIDFQGYLWFRLNEWWREEAEKQGCKEHHNASPTKLLPPEAKIYEDAVRHFVGAWEATQRVIISKADKHTQTWKDYRIVFKAFDSHLTEILSFVAQAVLSGNRHGAKEAAEMLMRWYGHSGTPGTHRGSGRRSTGASQIIVIRMEERCAITHGGVVIDNGKDQITNGASRSTPHLAWDFREGHQIIIDNRLTGNTEQLPIGGQLDAFGTLTDGAMFVFAAFGNLIQRIKRAHTHAAMLFEV